MADVFLSYSSEDRDLAERLARSLVERGWSVWWDRRVVIGQAFDKVIERELESAKSVVVLWSERSVASEWVRNEATAAAERGVLVPARIDGVVIPLEFRRKQTADLSDWDTDTAYPGYQALCEGIAATIAGDSHRPSLAHLQAPRRAGGYRGWALMLGVVVLVGVLAYWLWPSTGSESETSVDRSVSPATSESPATPALQSAGTASATAEQPQAPAPGIPDLAELIAGTYVGNISSDSKGSSRSDIVITVTRLDRLRVRITSDYHRIGTTDVTLTRIGEKIFAADGDSVLIAEYASNPPNLGFNPRNELAYSGTKVK
jgi:hypothetical protein